MLSKSHERVVPARGVPAEKMEVLKQMEKRAFGQIEELDNIINNLVDRANEGKKVRPTSAINVKTQPRAEMKKPVSGKKSQPNYY